MIMEPELQCHGSRSQVGGEPEEERISPVTVPTNISQFKEGEIDLPMLLPAEIVRNPGGGR